MGDVKLIRAFTIGRLSDLREHGLFLPNPDGGGTYYNSSWPKNGRSFYIESRNRSRRQVEVDAIGVGGINESYPLVAVIKINGRIFGQISEGLFGVDATNGFQTAKFNKLRRFEELKDCDEIVVLSSFLTPSWLEQLGAEIGIGRKDDYERKFFYAKFEEISRFDETRNDRRRR